MSKGDISVKFKAEQLGLSLENLAEEIEAQLQEDIKNVAHATYAHIIAKAQEKGKDKSQDYLKGLQFDVIGENEYLISLEGQFPNQIEEGWEQWSMREAMLKSSKIVQVGSRTGQPWVQLSKKGHKFAHVPMQKNPFSKNPTAAAFTSAMQKMKAVNHAGKLQKITKIFKDPQGNPLSGKVAVVKKFEGSEDTLKNLKGLIKYQQVHKDENGKTKVASSYMIFRTISENGKDWQGPAFEGIKAFIEAEAWADQEIEKILQYYLRG
jgi:hypothetical protein